MAAPDIKAIIFDCYGVLYLDSHVSLAQQYPDHAREIKDLSHQSDYGWLDKEDYLAGLSQITGESTTYIEDFINSEHHLNRELVEYIRSLKPRYKIGMLSNVGRGWLEEFFERHEIKPLFDAVVLSGEEGITKPSPEIFELAAAKLGVSPGACIMVDDIPDNCAGADAAGMKGIHFVSNTQTLTDLENIIQ